MHPIAWSYCTYLQKAHGTLLVLHVLLLVARALLLGSHSIDHDASHIFLLALVLFVPLFPPGFPGRNSLHISGGTFLRISFLALLLFALLFPLAPYCRYCAAQRPEFPKPLLLRPWDAEPPRQKRNWCVLPGYAQDS